MTEFDITYIKVSDKPAVDLSGWTFTQTGEVSFGYDVDVLKDMVKQSMGMGSLSDPEDLDDFGNTPYRINKFTDCVHVLMFTDYSEDYRERLIDWISELGIKFEVTDLSDASFISLTVQNDANWSMFQVYLYNGVNDV